MQITVGLIEIMALFRDQLYIKKSSHLKKVVGR